MYGGTLKIYDYGARTDSEYLIYLVQAVYSVRAFLPGVYEYYRCTKYYWNLLFCGSHILAAVLARTKQGHSDNSPGKTAKRRNTINNKRSMCSLPHSFCLLFLLFRIRVVGPADVCSMHHLLVSLIMSCIRYCVQQHVFVIWRSHDS